MACMMTSGKRGGTMKSTWAIRVKPHQKKEKPFSDILSEDNHLSFPEFESIYCLNTSKKKYPPEEGTSFFVVLAGLSEREPL